MSDAIGIDIINERFCDFWFFVLSALSILMFCFNQTPGLFGMITN
jgi:hypothetical protein